MQEIKEKVQLSKGFSFSKWLPATTPKAERILMIEFVKKKRIFQFFTVGVSGCCRIINENNKFDGCNLFNRDN